MDDMDAFDRQIAREVLGAVRPPRQVDPLAIFTAATQSRKWRFQPMFSATKFVLAGATVALFGGFLLVGPLTQPSDDRPPAVGASASAQAAPSDGLTASPAPSVEVVRDDATVRSDIVPGVDLVVEPVEPGVLRVVSDGIRDLSWLTDDDNRYDGGILAGTLDLTAGLTSADDVRLAEQAIRQNEAAITRNDRRLDALLKKNPKTPEERSEILALQSTNSDLRQATLDLQVRSRDGSDTSDGSIWWFAPQVFFRLGDEAAIERPRRDSGPARTDLPPRYRPLTCDGLAGFDGTAPVHFLRGFCIYAMDVAPGGSVWLQASNGASDTGTEAIHTYVITPEAAAASE